MTAAEETRGEANERTRRTRRTKGWRRRSCLDAPDGGSPVDPLRATRDRRWNPAQVAAKDEALHARQRREAERNAPPLVARPPATDHARDPCFGVEPESRARWRGTRRRRSRPARCRRPSRRAFRRERRRAPSQRRGESRARGRSRHVIEIARRTSRRSFLRTKSGMWVIVSVSPGRRPTSMRACTAVLTDGPSTHQVLATLPAALPGRRPRRSLGLASLGRPRLHLRRRRSRGLRERHRGLDAEKIRAAAEAGRVVVVARFVRDRPVGAAVAVQRCVDVEVVAALERAVRDRRSTRGGCRPCRRRRSRSRSSGNAPVFASVPVELRVIHRRGVVAEPEQLQRRVPPLVVASPWLTLFGVAVTADTPAATRRPCRAACQMRCTRARPASR